ncbi:MAG TPA: Ig-like domain-containing protein [Ignavibacteriaceae bacterium]
MARIIINLFLITTAALLFNSCIPDRMPTAPEEIDRPLFVQVQYDVSNLVFPLDHKIKLYFNEKMDLSTFPSNVIVESVSGRIDGTFSYGEADTIVVYSPGENYKPAEYYSVTIKGGVRDQQGNSMISPNEEDIPITDWFFTSGQYSDNGFPLCFIRDKSNRNMIYKVGELDAFLDSLRLPDPEDYQTSALEVERNSDKLFIVNLKLTDGVVTIVDPDNFSIIKQLTVGLGPTNIEFGSDKAYVTNSSAKSFSVIDLISLTTETTFTFPDEFRPKDVVFSTPNNRLYFYNTTNSDLKVVNAGDFNDSHIIASGLTTKPTDIEITKDGHSLYLLGTNSSVISVLNTDTEIPTVIDPGFQYLTDGTMGTDYYYAAYFRGTGGNDVGGVLKIDVSSNTITGSLEWEYQVDQLKLTSAEELLYAVTPVDSSIQIIETKTMKRISSSKVNGSLKYLAITNNNY